METSTTDIINLIEEETSTPKETVIYVDRGAKYRQKYYQTHKEKILEQQRKYRRSLRKDKKSSGANSRTVEHSSKPENSAKDLHNTVTTSSKAVSKLLDAAQELHENLGDNLRTFTISLTPNGMTLHITSGYVEHPREISNINDQVNISTPQKE